MNMGLTEHTGHGIPTIVKKYGKESFEIRDSYIRCIIPFDEEVLRQQNVGLSVGLNKTEKEMLIMLIENSDLTADELAIQIGVSKRTIERNFASLQQKGKLERVGSKRDGTWLVIK